MEGELRAASALMVGMSRWRLGVGEVTVEVRGEVEGGREGKEAVGV